VASAVATAGDVGGKDDLYEVKASGELSEGGEYTRVSRRLGFLDMVDAVWVVERLEHLKEAHFRCTVSGT